MRPSRIILNIGSAGTTISVPVGSITYTGFAPTVVTSDNQRVTTGAGSITFTGYAPVIPSSISIDTGAGTITYTGYNPTIISGDAQVIEVPVGSVTYTGLIPTVSASDNQSITVPVGAITYTGYAPTIVETGNIAVTTGAGSLTFTGYAPEIPGTISLTDVYNLLLALQTEIAGIRAKTDSLTFTVAGQVDSNCESMNGHALQGDGSESDKIRTVNAP